MGGARSRRLWTRVLGVVALAALAGACGSLDPQQEPADRAAATGERGYRGSLAADRQPLPLFSLRTPEGGRVSDRDLAGRVVVLTFLDAQCEASCPLVATNVARGLERLSPAERRHVEAIAISTHPHGDTPTAVRAFLRRQRAEDAITYLIGTEAELRPVWKHAKILSSLDSGQHDLHSAPVRIYGREGRWLATLRPGVDLSAENLAHDLRVALGDAA